MKLKRDNGSFRDPVGQVYLSENSGKVVRGLNEEFFKLQSKLLQENLNIKLFL